MSNQNTNLEETNIAKVTPRMLEECILTSFKTDVPLFIWGPPGVGKSDIVRQTSLKANLKNIIDIRAVHFDPVDFRGVPSVENKKTQWNPPSFLPIDGEGVLFVDELPQAPPLTQSSLFQLFLDRALGDYKLPDGWKMIAAGNRDHDRAMTHKISSALANRFMHVELIVSIEDWGRWALDNDIDTGVISFLRFRNELLHMFDPSKNEKAYPTPRSWEKVSKIKKSNPSKAVEFALYSGLVSQGPANEFIAYTKFIDKIPPIDIILMDPKNFQIPDEPSLRYAICTAVATKASEQAGERIFQLANRFSEENVKGADFSILLIKDCIKKCPKMMQIKGFSDWASKHSYAMTGGDFK